jgi:hypothetical protein
MTWALFWKKEAGPWHFAGMTPHDEKASEFEEMHEEQGHTTKVVALEDLR